MIPEAGIHNLNNLLSLFTKEENARHPLAELLVDLLLGANEVMSCWNINKLHAEAITSLFTRVNRSTGALCRFGKQLPLVLSLPLDRNRVTGWVSKEGYVRGHLLIYDSKVYDLRNVSSVCEIHNGKDAEFVVTTETLLDRMGLHNQWGLVNTAPIPPEKINKAYHFRARSDADRSAWVSVFKMYERRFVMERNLASMSIPHRVEVYSMLFSATHVVHPRSPSARVSFQTADGNANPDAASPQSSASSASSSIAVPGSNPSTTAHGPQSTTKEPEEISVSEVASDDVFFSERRGMAISRLQDMLDNVDPLNSPDDGPAVSRAAAVAAVAAAAELSSDDDEDAASQLRPQPPRPLPPLETKPSEKEESAEPFPATRAAGISQSEDPGRNRPGTQSVGADNRGRAPSQAVENLNGVNQEPEKDRVANQEAVERKETEHKGPEERNIEIDAAPREDPELTNIYSQSERVKADSQSQRGNASSQSERSQSEQSNPVLQSEQSANGQYVDQSDIEQQRAQVSEEQDRENVADMTSQSSVAAMANQAPPLPPRPDSNSPSFGPRPPPRRPPVPRGTRPPPHKAKASVEAEERKDSNAEHGHHSPSHATTVHKGSAAGLWDDRSRTSSRIRSPFAPHPEHHNFFYLVVHNAEESPHRPSKSPKTRVPSAKSPNIPASFVYRFKVMVKAKHNVARDLEINLNEPRRICFFPCQGDSRQPNLIIYPDQVIDVMLEGLDVLIAYKVDQVRAMVRLMMPGASGVDAFSKALSSFRTKLYPSFDFHHKDLMKLLDDPQSVYRETWESSLYEEVERRLVEERQLQAETLCEDGVSAFANVERVVADMLQLVPNSVHVQELTNQLKPFPPTRAGEIERLKLLCVKLFTATKCGCSAEESGQGGDGSNPCILLLHHAFLAVNGSHRIHAYLASKDRDLVGWCLRCLWQAELLQHIVLSCHSKSRGLSRWGWMVTRVSGFTSYLSLLCTEGRRIRRSALAVLFSILTNTYTSNSLPVMNQMGGSLPATANSLLDPSRLSIYFFALTKADPRACLAALQHLLFLLAQEKNVTSFLSIPDWQEMVLPLIFLNVPARAPQGPPGYSPAPLQVEEGNVSLPNHQLVRISTLNTEGLGPLSDEGVADTVRSIVKLTITILTNLHYEWLMRENGCAFSPGAQLLAVEKSSHVVWRSIDIAARTVGWTDDCIALFRTLLLGVFNWVKAQERHFTNNYQHDRPVPQHENLFNLLGCTEFFLFFLPTNAVPPPSTPDVPVVPDEVGPTSPAATSEAEAAHRAARPSTFFKPESQTLESGLHLSSQPAGACKDLTLVWKVIETLQATKLVDRFELSAISPSTPEDNIIASASASIFASSGPNKMGSYERKVRKRAAKDFSFFVLCAKHMEVISGLARDIQGVPDEHNPARGALIKKYENALVALSAFVEQRQKANGTQAYSTLARKKDKVMFPSPFSALPRVASNHRTQGSRWWPAR